MWLYIAALFTGSLLILVTSGFWQAIAQLVRSPYFWQATSAAKSLRDCGRFYHRGSGRREFLQPMDVALAS